MKTGNKNIRVKKNPRICKKCGFTVRSKDHNNGAHHQCATAPIGRYTPPKY